MTPKTKVDQFSELTGLAKLQIGWLPKAIGVWDSGRGQTKGESATNVFSSLKLVGEELFACFDRVRKSLK